MEIEKCLRDVLISYTQHQSEVLIGRFFNKGQKKSLKFALLERNVYYNIQKNLIKLSSGILARLSRKSKIR